MQDTLNFLRTALMSGMWFFVVLHDGSFYWAMINEEMLREHRFQFYINEKSTEIPLNNIVLPGKPGKQRNIFIIEPTTQNLVIARFVGFDDETFCFDSQRNQPFFRCVIRGTYEERIISFFHFVPRLPTEMEKDFYDSEFEKMEEFKRESLEMRRKCSPALRFPLALPRSIVDSFNYPSFHEVESMIVFFLLCERFVISLARTYDLNRLLIRFLACGEQGKFTDDIPILSQTQQFSFAVFLKRYNDEFIGLPMASDLQRASKLTEPELMCREFEVAKELKISSQCALDLPREYFTNPEENVILTPCKKHTWAAHSSLLNLK